MIIFGLIKQVICWLMYKGGINMDIKLPEALTSSEIIELFKTYEGGSEKIRNKLIEGNLKLVSNELKKFYSLTDEFSYIEKEDLFEIGCIGLIKAVDSFDYKKNFKFSTYAVKCIDHEILMYLRKLKVRKIGEITSLNVPISNDLNEDNIDDLKIDLVIANDNVEETCIRNETLKIIREAIDNLSEFERNLILMSYGIDCDSLTQIQLSKHFACSKSHINKKSMKARQKIKEYILEKYSGLK